MRALILGIGNIILGDEAVGVRAMEAVVAAYRLPEGVTAVDGGTSAMELLEDIADLDLLLVLDAILTDDPPGTVVRLAGGQVPVFFRSKLSPHQISLADVLASLEFMGRLPKDVVVIGVQPEAMDLSLEMSPVVAAQVPRLVELTVAEFASRGCPLEAIAR